VVGFLPFEENAVDDGFVPTADIRTCFPHSVTGCYSCSGEPVHNAGETYLRVVGPIRTGRSSSKERR
jgi:hypothetical protein